MWSLVSPVIIAKKVVVNSPYFMSIHAAQNNIGEGYGALILPLLTPSCVVLGSGTVAFCNLHLPYTDRYVYHIVYSQHFLIECVLLFFFLQRQEKCLKVIYFITVKWRIGKKKRNARFNVLVTLALNFLLWLLAGAALSRCPVFKSSILLVNVLLVWLGLHSIL